MKETPLKATDPCDLERLIMDSNIAKQPSAWWAKREIEALRTQVAELEAGNERLETQVANSGLVSKLTDAWCQENGSQMHWGKLVELVAVIEKLPDTERDRLLRLDYPDIFAERDELKAQLAEAKADAERLDWIAELEAALQAALASLNKLKETQNETK